MLPGILNSSVGRMPFKAWRRRAVYLPQPNVAQFDLAVLINETNVPADFFDIVENGGADIRCCQIDSRGFQEIPCEVVFCDTTNEKLQLWVKPTVLDTDIPIFMYYGNETVSTASTSLAWNGGYKQVYHLEETAGDFIDATSNNSDAVVSGTLPNPVTGIVGEAQDFDGIVDRATFAKSVDNDVTLECWVNTTDSQPSGANWYDGGGLIDGSTNGLGNDFGMTMIDGANAVLAGGVGEIPTTIKGTTQINDGLTHHCVMRRISNSGLITLYVDGVFEASGTGPTGGLGGVNTLSLGRTAFGTNNYYSGAMDEVRISSNFRGDNYIKETFASISNPATYMVLQPNL